MFTYLKGSIVRLLNFIVLSLIFIGLSTFAIFIGYKNYKTTTLELNLKAEAIAGLAAIAVENPIWNFDQEALENVARAILNDKDIVGIEVSVEGNEQPMFSFLGEDLKHLTFKDLEPNTNKLKILVNHNPVYNQGKQIGGVTIVTSMDKSIKQIKLAIGFVAIFSLVLLAIMATLIWFSARKIVARPLMKLELSAENLAQGNLDQDIDTSRIDEIGSLAKSFAFMRDSIKKKMENLYVLNSTGEVLAATHDQTNALVIVLNVLKKQTNVEYGSIYLLNENKELVLQAFTPEFKHAQVDTPKHFQIGEGLAGLAAQKREIIFVPDTSKAPGYTPPSNNDTPKSLLCIPMLDKHELFGVMNFSGDVGSIRFTNEDDQFALTIARLAVVTIKNIQMLELIEEQNRTLEQKVNERTTQLRQKTNDINVMLENIEQGIFTVTKDFTIHQEYSAYLELILEDTKLANRNFMEVLFGPNTSLGVNQLDQIENCIRASIGEDSMMFEFNSHLLINEYQKSMPDGRQKILQIDWSPIDNESDVIEKIMVTLRDVTQLRDLEIEANSQKQELDIISQILSVNQRKFNAFIDTSERYIDENEKIIEAMKSASKENIAHLYRNLHTIKGNARTYNFNLLTDVLHTTEQMYQSMRDSESDEDIFDKQSLLSANVRNHLARYKSVFENKLAQFAEPSPQDDQLKRSLLTTLKKELTSIETDTKDQAHEKIRELISLIRTLEAQPIDSVLQEIVEAMPSLAKELGKESPKVITNDNGILIAEDIAPTLKDLFTHLFRNSIDHGIESPADRVLVGKSSYGNIFVGLRTTKDYLEIRYYDDGRGLNLAKIAEKAINANLITKDATANPDAVANLIFESGISTAQHVSHVSGRGVGMDAVRSFIREIGGEIVIELKDNAGVGFTQFILNIKLPKSYAIENR